MEQTDNTLSKTFFKHCPPINELKKYASDRLSPQEEEMLDDLLNGCSNPYCKCEHILEGLQLELIAKQIASEHPEIHQEFDAKALFQKLKPEFEKASKNSQLKKYSKQIKTNPYFLVGGLAAAVSLIVLAYFITMILTSKPDITDQKEKIISQDSTPQTLQPSTTKKENNKSSDPLLTNSPKISSEKQKKSNTLPENTLSFVENTDLEKFIEMSKRGESQVRTISPENNAIFQDEVTLDWSATGWKIQELEVVDNQNNSVFKSTNLQEKIQVVIDLSNWKEGLYYWKLVVDNQMQYLGKFIKRNEK